MSLAERDVAGARRAVTRLVGDADRVRVEGMRFARAGRRLRVQGVTYGPFPPGPSGEPFPAAEMVADDFAGMRAAGINCVRTYHAPPAGLLELASRHPVNSLLAPPPPPPLS